MSLTIELSAEHEARLEEEARARGLAPTELARALLTEQLPPAGSGRPTSPRASRSQDPASRARSIRGKYAHYGATTEDLHETRQAEKDREDRPDRSVR